MFHSKTTQHAENGCTITGKEPPPATTKERRVHRQRPSAAKNKQIHVLPNGFFKKKMLKITVIRKFHIKTVMRYYHTLMRMGKIRNTKFWKGCRGIGILMLLVTK